MHAWFSSCQDEKIEGMHVTVILYFAIYDDEYDFQPSDRGAVANLVGVSRDAASVIISWDAPPCPNGPIRGYHVYYRRANYTQSKPIISSGYNSVLIRSRNASLALVIDGLTLGQCYSFHVRGFNNEFSPGRVDRELLVKIKSQVALVNSDLQSVLSRVSASSHQLVIGLPSSAALMSFIGITNFVLVSPMIIIYYNHVIIVDFQLLWCDCCAQS